MKLIALTLLLFGAVAPATAAADQVTAYRALVQQDLRLANIGYQLAAANAPYCVRRERNPGWVIHDEQQYPDREVARAAFVFRTPVAVSAVVPGGPADAMGVKAGDGVVGLNDGVFSIHSEVQHKPSAERMETIQKALRAAMTANGRIRITLETADGQKQITLEPPAICASRFWVDARSKLDAGADGDGVRVTDGLMAFTASDDAELAAVVAHELSHNLLGHRERLNAAKRRTSEILATEIEADRLSVWLMANAGYDPNAALRFAERYGRKTGLGIFSDGTHLRWKNRVKVMRGEIIMMKNAKKQNGLLPPPLLVGDELATLGK